MPGPEKSKISTNTRVICPVCGATTCSPYKEVDGKWYFPHHGPHIMEGDSCEASGWLIEDEDIATEKEKVTA